MAGRQTETADATRSLIARLQGDPQLAGHVLAVLDGGSREPLVPRSAWNTELVVALTGLPEAELAPGTAIGPYRVTRALGRGGMGVVYRAERADGEFTRTVALKIARYPAHPATLARLRAERQTLIGLDHPAIVRLIDGGTTEDGVPFFLSDYIDGAHLDAYCAEHGLTGMERLRLVERISAGVEAAHAAGVIHADLKPANILVTSDGAPKLCDFGLADTTAVGYSLPYAAPEQLEERPLTVTADVYALGAVLYELLTGRPPVDLPTRDAASWLDAKRRAVPPPSTLLSVPGLPRRLHPDLDAILLRALRAGHQERYTSAAAFREDLIRLRTDHPVQARATPWSERTAKLCRRHPRAALATLLVTLALVGFAMTLWVQRDHAQRAAEEARAVARALTNVFSLADPDTRRGTEITAAELLAAGQAQAEQELSAQPRLLGRVLGVLGRSYARLGDLDAAERNLTRAAALLAEDSDPEARALVVADLGALYTQLQRSTEAEPLLRESLRVLEPLTAYTREVGRILDVLGSSSRDQGDFTAAREWYTRARTWRSTRLGPRHPDIAVTLGHLALLEKQEGHYDAAEDLLAHALAIDTEAHGDTSPRVASDLANLASVQIERGNYAAALPYLRRAVDLKITIFGDDNIEISRSMTDLGYVLSATGEKEEAERTLLKALAIKEAHLDPTHPSIAQTLELLGLHYEDHGDPKSAERALRRALSIRTGSQGAGHLATLYTQVNLAGVLVGSDPEEAHDLITKALPGLSSAPISARIEAEYVLAATLHAMKDPTCRAAYDRVLALNATILDHDPGSTNALQVESDATRKRQDCPPARPGERRSGPHDSQ